MRSHLPAFLVQNYTNTKQGVVEWNTEENVAWREKCRIFEGLEYECVRVCVCVCVCEGEREREKT